MSPPLDSNQQQQGWAAAKAAYERGDSLRQCAKLAHVSHESIRLRAISEGWLREGETAQQAAEQREQRTRAAREEAARKWANRKAAEADAAGISASATRQALVQAVQNKDDKMIRALTPAYTALITTAQLLSGSATSRDVGPLSEQVDRIRQMRDQARDEVAARREARAGGW